jgi:hypothetical protein
VGMWIAWWSWCTLMHHDANLNICMALAKPSMGECGKNKKNMVVWAPHFPHQNAMGYFWDSSVYVNICAHICTVSDPPISAIFRFMNFQHTTTVCSLQFNAGKPGSVHSL